MTGHTGFKGSWMTEWLLSLGAEVVGVSLADMPTEPCLFVQLGLRDRVRHHEGDIRDGEYLSGVVAAEEPDFVFHLAAQSLVRRSYEAPVETFGTNLMGTVNLLEAVRACGRPVTVVLATTDKCYENREWDYAYREGDPLGGYDPYSASKACAELAIGSYRKSFAENSREVRTASARAGNVIGGGDWAQDRIVPDCIRYLRRKEGIIVRNRHATRPWQHVLEPLGGYLWLGAELELERARGEGDDERAEKVAGAFNFGPNLDANRTVAELVEEVLKSWPGEWIDQSEPGAHHEASRLNLAVDKAYHLLEWRPAWGFEKAVARTVECYRRIEDGEAACGVVKEQISEYYREASGKGIAWAGN